MEVVNSISIPNHNDIMGRLGGEVRTIMKRLGELIRTTRQYYRTYCTVLYCPVLHCTTLYSNTLYCIALHYTVL